MVKKIAALSLCLAAFLSVSACSVKIGGFEFGSEKSESSEESYIPQNTKPELVTEPETEAIKLDPVDYYCIADDVKINSRVHDHGTCWAFAAAASMETAAAIRNGKTISIEPHDIIDTVFQTDKKEGYFLDKKVDPLDAGGNCEMVVDSLANGFGSYVLENAEYFMDYTVDELKDAVRIYGGLTACVPTTSACEGEYDGELTYNEPDPVDYDHLVTIIGFDNDFPKENFNVPAAENGAWIVRNSSVENERYYISYETPLESVTGLSLTDEYSHVLSYDAGNPQLTYISLQNEENNVAANVFHEAGTLAGVGTYSITPDQTVIIEVRSADLKKVHYAQKAYFATPGYHTVKFPEPLEVENYAISISYPDGIPVEAENFGLENSNYKVFTKLGVSFIKVGKQWYDLCNDNELRTAGLSFTPNNCCIKALYK